MTDEPNDTVLGLERSEGAPAPKEEKPARRDDAGRFSREESDDKALDRILGKVEPQKKPESEATRKEEKPPAQSPDLVKAKKALELDGFTEEDLEGFSDDRLLALGKKVQKRQADVGKKLSARTEEEPATTAAKKEATEEPKGLPPELNFKELAKGVGDLLGDDVGDALAQALEKSLTPLTAKLKAAEQELAQRRGQEIETQAQSARSELKGQFPDLADDDVFEKVAERMLALAPVASSFGPTLKDLMEAACRQELFQPGGKPPEAPVKQRDDKARNQGQPTPVNRTKPSTAKTKAERDEEELDEIFGKHGINGRR